MNLIFMAITSEQQKQNVGNVGVWRSAALSARIYILRPCGRDRIVRRRAGSLSNRGFGCVVYARATFRNGPVEMRPALPALLVRFGRHSFGLGCRRQHRAPATDFHAIHQSIAAFRATIFAAPHVLPSCHHHAHDFPSAAAEAPEIVALPLLHSHQNSVLGSGASRNASGVNLFFRGADAQNALNSCFYRV
jgi:hypothetical protein